MKTKSKKPKTNPNAPEVIITLRNWGGIKRQQWRGIPSRIGISSPWDVSSILGQRSIVHVAPMIETSFDIALTRGIETSHMFSL